MKKSKLYQLVKDSLKEVLQEQNIRRPKRTPKGGARPKRALVGQPGIEAIEAEKNKEKDEQIKKQIEAKSKLENYGMIIPKRFEHSKQLYAEFRNSSNNSSKVNLLISWVNQTQRKCSIEIWSDEPFSQNKTLCRKVHNEIIQLIKPLNLSSQSE